MKSEDIYFYSDGLNGKEFILLLSAGNLHIYAYFFTA
jgi:hypothetical protein